MSRHAEVKSVQCGLKMRAEQKHQMTPLRFPVVCLVMLLVSASPHGRADTVIAAVAANFFDTLSTLEPLFEAATRHELELVAGSTGQLYAQITHGAPFDVFFAADQERPARAVSDGLAVAGSRLTYAVGVLVLYSPDPARVTGPDSLRGEFRTLAMANPMTAPYGTAAREVLEGLELWSTLHGRVALAQDVGGAYAAVKSGAAELAFVARSSVLSENNSAPGSTWVPPTDSYAPIRQDVVLLKRAAENPGAQVLLDFVRTPEARELIRRRGYGVD